MRIIRNETITSQNGPKQHITIVDQPLSLQKIGGVYKRTLECWLYLGENYGGILNRNNGICPDQLPDVINH